MNAALLWRSVPVVVLLLLLVGNALSLHEEASYLAAQHDHAFNTICAAKYDFVSHYLRQLERETERDTNSHTKSKFLVFVFHSDSFSTGGLGDRLAGLVTATAWAMRRGRILVVDEGDTAGGAFQRYFRPHPPLSRSQSASPGSSMFESYGSAMKRVQKLRNKNSSAVLHCLNEKSTTPLCRFHELSRESASNDDEVQVIDYVTNRAYLCSWTQSSSLSLIEEMKALLNTTDLKNVNLYEVAGCLLRTVMSPTELLWEDMITHLTHLNDEKPLPSFKLGSNRQVGIHFRCGDASTFSVSQKLKHQSRHSNTNKADILSKASSCTINIHAASMWKGIQFMDDISPDSPIDLAQCALKQFRKLFHNAYSIAYIASDSSDAAVQIAEHTTFRKVLYPKTTCHVDNKATAGTVRLCHQDTLLQWFVLAQSDLLVTQSGFSTVSNTTSLPFPISAFSRYAAIYGLRTILSFGVLCKEINQLHLSHQSQGNWVC